MKTKLSLFITIICVLISEKAIAANTTVSTASTAVESSSAFGIRYLVFGITAAFIVTVLIRSRKKKL